MRIGHWLTLTVVLLGMWIPRLWYDFGDGIYQCRRLSGIIIPMGILPAMLLAVWWKRIAPLTLILITPLTMYLIFDVSSTLT